MKMYLINYNADESEIIISCRYCGCIVKVVCNGKKDLGARAEAISEMKQHIESYHKKGE